MSAERTGLKIVELSDQLSRKMKAVRGRPRTHHVATGGGLMGTGSANKDFLWLFHLVQHRRHGKKDDRACSIHRTEWDRDCSEC